MNKEVPGSRPWAQLQLQEPAIMPRTAAAWKGIIIFCLAMVTMICNAVLS